jgi:hypothetical protein
VSPEYEAWLWKQKKAGGIFCINEDSNSNKKSSTGISLRRNWESSKKKKGRKVQVNPKPLFFAVH